MMKVISSLVAANTLTFQLLILCLVSRIIFFPEGLLLQVAEKQFDGVMVGLRQLMDQFLHSLNFRFGFFNLC